MHSFRKSEIRLEDPAAQRCRQQSLQIFKTWAPSIDDLVMYHAVRIIGRRALPVSSGAPCAAVVFGVMPRPVGVSRLEIRPIDPNPLTLRVNLLLVHSDVTMTGISRSCGIRFRHSILSGTRANCSAAIVCFWWRRIHVYILWESRRGAPNRFNRFNRAKAARRCLGKEHFCRSPSYLDEYKRKKIFSKLVTESIRVLPYLL